jgi:hypothetical protein
MTTTTAENRAQLAYTAYGKSLNFTDKQGEEMPTFIELSEPERVAWRVAADAIWELAKTGKLTI